MNKSLTMKELASKIREKKSTLIFCHRNPDPDTLGSAFALKEILEHLGIAVSVCCADKPNAKFSFITGEGLLNEIKIDEYERAIAIDVGSSKQLGDFSCYADKISLIIDHHEMNERFADYYEDFAPASAMIVYELALELGILDSLGERFFSCVYAGLSGDTGCFKYSNTNKRAHLIAADLVTRGIDFAKINNIIFDSKSIGEVSAIRMAYENVELLLDGRLAILLVTNEMKSKYGITDDDIGDIVNTIRQIQGTLIAVSIKEAGSEGRFSISSRANADIDVSALCAELGGGGHPRASGATLYASSPSEALDTIRTLFSKGVLGYGK